MESYNHWVKRTKALPLLVKLWPWATALLIADIGLAVIAWLVK